MDDHLISLLVMLLVAVSHAVVVMLLPLHLRCRSSNACMLHDHGYPPARPHCVLCLKRKREREREILIYSLIFSYYTPYYTFIVHEHNRVLHGWRLIFEGYEWCVESVISCIYAYILFRASYCKMREPSAKHFALMRNHIAGGTKMHVARFLCKDSSATDTCNASCAGVFMRSGHARSWSCC
jgi:hypothetical protein